MIRSTFFAAALLGLFALAQAEAASNCIVNLSHYDTVAPDFAAMRRDGVIGIIHEATYPPSTVDPRYADRQSAATRAGLRWGAYHFANGTDPTRQADQFLNSVASRSRSGNPQPSGVLLVLDFEQNRHYPGGTMTVSQAATFVRRIHERTGKYPGLYSGEFRVKKILGDPKISAADRATLSNCWLWIANYHYVPRETAFFGQWTLWQYTGDGTCDLQPRKSYPTTAANVRRAERNFFRGGTDAAKAFWDAHAWQF
jgi:lysozyme